jgi:hypothetical protein
MRTLKTSLRSAFETAFREGAGVFGRFSIVTPTSKRRFRLVRGPAMPADHDTRPLSRTSIDVLPLGIGTNKWRRADRDGWEFRELEASLFSLRLRSG